LSELNNDSKANESLILDSTEEQQTMILTFKPPLSRGQDGPAVTRWAPLELHRKPTLYGKLPPPLRAAGQAPLPEFFYTFFFDFRKINGRIKKFEKYTSRVKPHGGRNGHDVRVAPTVC
jgi:hypothetical protein